MSFNFNSDYHFIITLFYNYLNIRNNEVFLIDNGILLKDYILLVTSMAIKTHSAFQSKAMFSTLFDFLQKITNYNHPLSQKTCVIQGILTAYYMILSSSIFLHYDDYNVYQNILKWIVDINNKKLLYTENDIILVHEIYSCLSKMEFQIT